MSIENPSTVGYRTGIEKYLIIWQIVFGTPYLFNWQHNERTTARTTVLPLLKRIIVFVPFVFAARELIV